ncbi:DUF397 domain-containing protein [Kitasatospora purpeofusca]|uniref:DUF397 domain-containing protein n=1 Tax=Kitasatospora purpeofusca TaxID=67352 RepID=A0ABZ1TVU2_9ACTN|nr:DUF397 domain-containing protein [Kitasatospora purpeofusca]
MSGDVVWFKSSYSGGEGGDCVEVAEAAESVLVRDSKDKFGPRLAFSSAAWRSFVEFAQVVR